MIEAFRGSGANTLATFINIPMVGKAAMGCGGRGRGKYFLVFLAGRVPKDGAPNK